MKKYIVLLIIALGITSCSSLPKETSVIESDTGLIYKSSHLDYLRGMSSGKRDDEVMKFSDEIIAKAGKPGTDSSGTYYPGTVKVISWDNNSKYQALRLVKCKDGTEFWQGPTPPSGFYGSKLKTTYLY